MGRSLRPRKSVTYTEPPLNTPYQGPTYVSTKTKGKRKAEVLAERSNFEVSSKAKPSKKDASKKKSSSKSKTTTKENAALSGLVGLSSLAGLGSKASKASAPAPHPKRARGTKRTLRMVPEDKAEGKGVETETHYSSEPESPVVDSPSPVVDSPSPVVDSPSPVKEPKSRKSKGKSSKSTKPSRHSKTSTRHAVVQSESPEGSVEAVDEPAAETVEEEPMEVSLTRETAESSKALEELRGMYERLQKLRTTDAEAALVASEKAWSKKLSAQEKLINSLNEQIAVMTKVTKYEPSEKEVKELQALKKKAHDSTKEAEKLSRELSEAQAQAQSTASKVGRLEKESASLKKQLAAAKESEMKAKAAAAESAASDRHEAHRKLPASKDGMSKMYEDLTGMTMKSARGTDGSVVCSLSGGKMLFSLEEYKDEGESWMELTVLKGEEFAPQGLKENLEDNATCFPAEAAPAVVGEILHMAHSA